MIAWSVKPNPQCLTFGFFTLAVKEIDPANTRYNEFIPLLEEKVAMGEFRLPGIHFMQASEGLRVYVADKRHV